MRALTFLKLPFNHREGWKELQASSPSIPLLAWLVVLPMSLLPPVMLYYAGTHYGDAFMAGFADREWRFITTIIFLAEILSFFVIGWVIYAVVNGTEELSISYQDAYLLATLAPLPLFVASLALLVPSLLFNVVVILSGLGISCSLIYRGLKALCTHQEFDVATISATYTIMAASALGWGILFAVIWAY
ncbi:YIP1 family protein [Halomonas sp. IOP_14]|uniref:YIP1 family protein n=1 Tax=Halomonas sp. IOP_14 TaxID=2873295 RepID=UPI001E4FC77E|nr:YIP1 family protein [Halomonas sp. IOP_14]MCD1587436.1 YIP1 family protein [Halomonas sp. IOP_14]